ncbi:hypothetical protein BDN72DRAFT_436229 [Pluteus cervinus]|uniref:Uncharacterized protein n=1 Tax=Pluteus cervinus TaxID=181527 RepID=A0ACD3B1I8_9AGAR|nr:hypothetical protein BDN72DRAFT_436229 [Pluteus cervinus]
MASQWPQSMPDPSEVVTSHAIRVRIDDEGVQAVLSLLSLRTRVPSLYQLSMLGPPVAIPNTRIQETVEDIIPWFRPTDLHFTAIETRVASPNRNVK